MKFYLAPMEGITGYLYRNACRKYFGSIDKYFTPFITPHTNRSLNAREKKDILPEHNQGMHVVPQILTNQAQDFIRTGRLLKEFGYEEINLNLGCPSGTVTARKRGAGFLAYPRELNRFLEEVCSGLNMKISVKTRIGLEDGEEFFSLLDIYNQYPLEELIIHPRVQADYYRNQPDWMIFRYAMEYSKNLLCYNGDIFHPSSYEAFVREFPDTDRIMLGRGSIANPGLADLLKEGNKLDKQELKAFHDEVCQGYQESFSGDRNVLFKMKELWFYMGQIFSDSDKYLKKIRKSQKLPEYRSAVESLFREQELLAEKGFCPPEK